MKIVPAVRGMHDILPQDAPSWSRVENAFGQCAALYGYAQLRTPVLEREELFLRPVGEATDIVSKELFKLPAADGETLCMRPEGTVAVARALAQKGLLRGQTQRVWYLGQMFRKERPQQGRQRQFHQFGAELLGDPQPSCDVEILQLCSRVWRELGIADKVQLQINNLGSAAERESYVAKLKSYFSGFRDRLSQVDRDRLQSNPLRLLDSKDEAVGELLCDAPLLADHLGDDSRAHFDKVREGLDKAGIGYQENPLLVRGLDYYNLTVFEWVDPAFSGRQNTLAAGGRYDGLVGLIGGQPCPGTGVAAGLERIIELCAKAEPEPAAQIYLAAADDAMPQHELDLLAEKIRDRGISVIKQGGTGRIRNLFKRADASSAVYAVVIGPREVEQQTASVKPLRSQDKQLTLSLADLDQQLDNLINGSPTSSKP